MRLAEIRGRGDGLMAAEPSTPHIPSPPRERRRGLGRGGGDPAGGPSPGALRAPTSPRFAGRGEDPDTGVNVDLAPRPGHCSRHALRRRGADGPYRTEGDD